MVIAHLSREILVISAHIDESVTGKVEQDGLRLTSLFAFERLGHCRGDRVAGLWSGDDALCLGEQEIGRAHV